MIVLVKPISFVQVWFRESFQIVDVRSMVLLHLKSAFGDGKLLGVWLHVCHLLSNLFGVRVPFHLIGSKIIARMSIRRLEIGQRSSVLLHI